MTAPGIVDSHQHFISIDRFDYYWMKPGRLSANYLPDDLLPHLTDNGVAATIAVQAHPSIEEARFLFELSRENPFIASIVPAVDLLAESLPENLEEYRSMTNVVAVRHQQAEDLGPLWFRQADVIEGLRRVSEIGLCYDLLLRDTQLDAVPRLLDAIPGLQVVLEHMAKPRIRDGAFDSWAMNLERLRPYPQLLCKLSGIITEANHDTWTSDDIRPYIQHAVEVFGFDRIMWGSDWPVCLLAGSYGQTLESTLDAIGPITDSQREKLLRENARRFYRLD